MSTLLSNLNYENCQPKLETKETPESHILLVHLPGLYGYAQENIGAQFECNYRRVRVFGGRPLGDNRSIRFNIAYAIPWNCDVNKLKGMFQGEIFSVIMPKVTTSSEVPDQNSPKSSFHIIEKAQKEETSYEEPNTRIESHKKLVNETSTTLKATSDSMPKEGEKGISQDAKNQTQEKVENIGEKKRVDRKDNKEESENACALGKPPKKGKKENVMDETSFITKSEENGSSKRKGIKEVATSASHVVTSLVKRFSEEDMMISYTTATVLVLAVGVYASYKLRSSARG